MPPNEQRLHTHTRCNDTNSKASMASGSKAHGLVPYNHQGKLRQACNHVHLRMHGATCRTTSKKRETEEGATRQIMSIDTKGFRLVHVQVTG